MLLGQRGRRENDVGLVENGPGVSRKGGRRSGGGVVVVGGGLLEKINK